MRINSIKNKYFFLLQVKSLTNEAIAIFRGVLRKSIPEAFRRRNQTAKDGQRPQIHIEVYHVR
jgi:hypothetical protein